QAASAANIGSLLLVPTCGRMGYSTAKPQMTNDPMTKSLIEQGCSILPLTPALSPGGEGANAPRPTRERGWG
ncbi:hypothetical protein DRN50_07975, partial [Thermococci archaeon]